MSEQQSLVERVAKDFHITDAEMDQIWTEFDKDRSGGLSLEESKDMLREFLTKVLGKVAGTMSFDRMLTIFYSDLEKLDADDGKRDGKLDRATVQEYLNMTLGQEKRRLSQMADVLLSQQSKYEDTDEWDDYLQQLVPILERIQHPQAEQLRSRIRTA